MPRIVPSPGSRSGAPTIANGSAARTIGPNVPIRTMMARLAAPTTAALFVQNIRTVSRHQISGCSGNCSTVNDPGSWSESVFTSFGHSSDVVRLSWERGRPARFNKRGPAAGSPRSWKQRRACGPLAGGTPALPETPVGLRPTCGRDARAPGNNAGPAAHLRAGRPRSQESRALPGRTVATTGQGHVIALMRGSSAP